MKGLRAFSRQSIWRVSGVRLGTLYGRFSFTLLYGIRTNFCTESVQNFVRIPYKKLYGFRTQFCTGSVFFLRRPDFRVQNPTQIFGTDSVHFFVRIPYNFLYGFRTRKPQNASPLARTPLWGFGVRVRIPYKKVYGFRTKKCTESAPKILFSVRGAKLSAASDRACLAARGRALSPRRLDLRALIDRLGREAVGALCESLLGRSRECSKQPP